jgi:HPt (histidine-containing phosphotransfer) domain-containing protein
MTRMNPLATLRLSYAEAMPARLRTLERAIRAWRRAPDDVVRLDRAWTLAHRLHGTAGSYGLRAVSAAIAAIADALQRVREAREEARFVVTEPALADARRRTDHAIAALRRQGNVE